MHYTKQFNHKTCILYLNIESINSPTQSSHLNDTQCNTFNIQTTWMLLIVAFSDPIMLLIKEIETPTLLIFVPTLKVTK